MRRVETKPKDMEKIIKINYAPDTVFIVGNIWNAEVKILNSKATKRNKYGQLNGIPEHCQKCKEQILQKLN